MSNNVWHPWPDMCLRSAGLPLDELLRLADPELAALALDVDADPQQLRTAWHRSIHRSVDELLDMAENDSFRAALLWQNPNAIDNVSDWLRRHANDATRNQDRRRKEANLTRYAQRYHARNETIGFFGPSAWTRFDESIPYISVTPGAQSVSQRTVYFEDWAIDALGGALAEDPVIRRRLPPTRLLGVTVQGTLAVYPDGSPCRLPPLDAAVLAVVDGMRTLRNITLELRWQGAEDAPREEDVVGALERLLDRGLILWRPNVPVDRWPERALRKQLVKLPESREQAVALEALEQLEKARDAVAFTAGRPDLLAEALAHLGRKMEEITGRQAIQTKNQRRFGRRAIYEDCARDVELRLGTGLRAALFPPLSLMLDSARWLTWQFGESLKGLIGDLYDQFDSMTPGDGVPLGIIVNQLLERLADPSWADPIVEEFQKTWMDILAWPAHARRVRFDSADLAAAVGSAFCAPPPLWYGASQHSPDIMIAAAGLTELQKGRFEFILGEVHLAIATLDDYAFALTHPDTDRLLQEAEEGLRGRPRVVPAYTRSPKVSGRDYPPPELFSDRYWYLSLAPGNGEREVPRGRSLFLEKLVAERVGTSITVPIPSGERLDVLEVVGEFTRESLVNLFRPLPPLPHTPRVTIDQMVIAREKWRVPAHEVPTGSSQDEAGAFGALRRWADANGIPRFVFWRTATGTKPVYLDLDSPLFVNDFLTAVRQARGLSNSTVEITEMHPDSHHVWLPDAKGRLYSCELRLVVTDRSGQVES